MSVDIPCDADALTLKRVLEKFDHIHSVYVSRSNVDVVGGYTWTISYIDEETKDQRGDIPELIAHSSLSSGSEYLPTVGLDELRKGTKQEVQAISVHAENAIDPSSSFRLRFRGEVTNDINVLSLDGSACSGARVARQVITSSTENSSEEGGDDAISPLTQFSLVYANRTSERIFANLERCDEVALKIKNELEAMPEFQDISVSSEGAISGNGSCKWEVTFNGYLGNPELLQGKLPCISPLITSSLLTLHVC